MNRPSIDPCTANERRATSGSPFSRKNPARLRALAMQSSITPAPEDRYLPCGWRPGGLAQSWRSRGPLGGTADAAPSNAADGPGGASAGQRPYPSSRALLSPALPMEQGRPSGARILRSPFWTVPFAIQGSIMPVEPTVERIAYQEADFPNRKVGNPHRLIKLALRRLLDGKTGHPLSSKPPWAVQFRSERACGP
jgi:hypothetical protein